METTFEREGPTSSCDFFPDLVANAGEEIMSVSVVAGQTMFFPPGWIHGVITLEETVAISGNFWPIGTFKVPLLVRSTESADKSLPMFDEIAWFAADR